MENPRLKHIDIDMTFTAFLSSIGLIPPRDIEPGKITRCPTLTHPRKKNGRFMLSRDGKRGWGIDSAIGETCKWSDRETPEERSAEQRAHDNAELSARLAKARDDERAAILAACIAYTSAKPVRNGDHPYLAAKRLTQLGASALRIDDAGNLLIPMRRHSAMRSVQRISPTGSKLFAHGAPAKLATHTIERPRATVTILCEGYATGATLFEAVNVANVIVCFSASNMVAVAERQDWRGLVAVAGDDDYKTICHRHKAEGADEPCDPRDARPEWCQCNPGKTAAIKTARAIGCGWTVPGASVCGSDFNDAFCERLTELEAANAEQPRPRHASALRAAALAPIRAEVMRVAKNI